MADQTPEQKIVTENPEYTHFVVDSSLLEIDSGWHYKSDAQDYLAEMVEENTQAREYYRVWTRKYTKRFFQIN